jgi:murein DD-endopeptidase MepM/ murein hydrolase activator NlpD
MDLALLNRTTWVTVLFVLILPIAAMAGRQSPVDNGVLTSGAGWRIDPFGSGRKVYHKGYDIAVPVGTPVYPVEEGTVFFAGPYGAYGNLVAIDHGNGYLTYYGHNSEVRVQVGQVVDTATVVALSGSTGHSTGPHVHYEMRVLPGYEVKGYNGKIAGKPAEVDDGGVAGGRGGADVASKMPQDDP